MDPCNLIHSPLALKVAQEILSKEVMIDLSTGLVLVTRSSLNDPESGISLISALLEKCLIRDAIKGLDLENI